VIVWLFLCLHTTGAHASGQHNIHLDLKERPMASPAVVQTCRWHVFRCATPPEATRPGAHQHAAPRKTSHRGISASSSL